NFYNPSEMMVTWSTIDDPQGSVVEFGLNHITEKTFNGSSIKFVDQGAQKLTQYIHRVLLRDLSPGKRYIYHCGSKLGWSEIFFFTAMKSGANFSPHLALYGDLGAENSQSLTRLQEEVQDGKYDAILHVGDFAYNMETVYCLLLAGPNTIHKEMFGLEDLLVTYGVDLAIWAHEHSYERLFPLYNKTVYNGSMEEPYKNPKSLTHIITGSAGCWSRHDPFPKNMPPWSAFRTVDYGYSRMQAINYTHLYFEQVSIDQGGKVIDSFHLIRENHAPYGPFPKM
ncbi:unnamed protein product, partial [Allacma fusca]